MTIPSPHVSEQLLPDDPLPPLHEKPVSIAQVELQPSLSSVFPSSQYPATTLTTFPSPQISLQTLAVDPSPGVHCQSLSTAQVELHPSPSITFPSSQ